MPPKQQYHTIKRRKKSPTGIIMVVVLILVIAVGGTAVGLMMVSNAVGDVVKGGGVTLTCSVSGNNLVVEIYEGGNADSVNFLELALQGYTLPPGYSIKEVPKSNYPKKIVYENVVAGIYGELQVSFKATFADGTSKVVWMDSVKFT